MLNFVSGVSALSRDNVLTWYSTDFPRELRFDGKILIPDKVIIPAHELYEHQSDRFLLNNLAVFDLPSYEGFGRYRGVEYASYEVDRETRVLLATKRGTGLLGLVLGNNCLDVLIKSAENMGLPTENVHKLVK